MKLCRNCKHRSYLDTYFDMEECCIGYEMCETEEDEAMEAAMCERYEEGTPEYLEEDYCPSASNGDYSPSNPCDAPGMSVKDFI